MTDKQADIILWIFVALFAAAFLYVALLQPKYEPESACDKDWTESYTENAQILKDCLDEKGVK